MNNRNERANSQEDAEKYLANMLANAEKHGIAITSLTYRTLTGYGSAITKYAKGHMRELQKELDRLQNSIEERFLDVLFSEMMEDED